MQLLILFWICAAGKNGVTSAKCLDKLLSSWRPTAEMVIPNPTPFEIIGCINYNAILSNEMRLSGIGCYNNKAISFMSLINANLDLKTCTVEDLVGVKGIGFKTANGFLMHTRPDYQGACLDVHILRYLSSLGYDVPKVTPQSKNTYLRIQSIFMDICKKLNKTPAELDLEIWVKSSKNL